MSDTGALLDHLATQADVKPGGIGVVGYCRGGMMSLTAAGTFRIRSSPLPPITWLSCYGVAASLISAPQMRAWVYVAGAIEDSSFPDDMKYRLEDALTRRRRRPRSRNVSGKTWMVCRATTPPMIPTLRSGIGKQSRPCSMRR